MPNSGSPSPASDAFDQFHARPDTAGILPAAARPAQPFAENGARQDEAPLVFLHGPVERCGLAGGPHANADERGQQVGRDRQARTFRDVIDVADDLQAAARADNPRQQIGQALARTFDARRHNARRDHRRLQQAQDNLSRNRTLRPGA